MLGKKNCLFLPLSVYLQLLVNHFLNWVLVMVLVVVLVIEDVDVSLGVYFRLLPFLALACLCDFPLLNTVSTLINVPSLSRTCIIAVDVLEVVLVLEMGLVVEFFNELTSFSSSRTL